MIIATANPIVFGLQFGYEAALDVEAENPSDPIAAISAIIDSSTTTGSFAEELLVMNGDEAIMKRYRVPPEALAEWLQSYDAACINGVEMRLAELKDAKKGSSEESNS